MVGRINGKLGTLNWTPVIYKYSSLSFEELNALYTSSDVALITPIRDGMNLVAKEFVASRKDKQGVLILSEMAGASNELSEALHINPTDPEDVADRIKEALEMDTEEQKFRMEKMQVRIEKYNVNRWVKDFLYTLEKPQELKAKKEAKFLDPDKKRDLLINYQNSKKRLFLLDYDGTLVDFSKQPDLAVPAENVKEMLGKIATNPSNTVMIVSGRDADTLQKFLGDLPLSLVAEHGSLIKREKEWISLSSDPSDWKKIIAPVLEDFTDRCAKSFIEEKSYSIAWHYRNVAPELGFQRSRELINALEHLSNDLKLRILY
jgi:trehalose 6-phosphate synthase/phosphatase